MSVAWPKRGIGTPQVPRIVVKRNHWGNMVWQKIAKTNWSLTIMYISRREIKWRNSDHNILLWIDLSVNCESPVRSMGGVLRILWCILWSLCICYSKLHPHYLRRPGALFFSSLLPSSTINTISKGNLYSFICTPKRGTEGFIGQSKRFISFGPTTGDVYCTIPVRKRFQSRISNLSKLPNFQKPNNLQSSFQESFQTFGAG